MPDPIVIALELDDARGIRDELRRRDSQMTRLVTSGVNVSAEQHQRVKRWAEILTTRIERLDPK